jgi:hypothetical protein
LKYERWVGRWVFAFLQIYLDESIPLWTIASVASGGPGNSGTAIGSMLGLGGIAMLFGNVVIYPIMAARHQPTGILAKSTLAFAVVVTAMPLATRWVLLHIDSTLALWITLGLLNGVRASDRHLHFVHRCGSCQQQCHP